MRKILSLVLALCMTLALVPAVAESADVTGVWYAAKMGSGETLMDISALGIQMILTLNEDGTATMDASGAEVQEGTWSKTDADMSVTFQDETIPFTVKDGELTMADSAGTQVIVFTREAPAPLEFAEVKSDSTVADFNGTYEIAYMQNGESYINAEALATTGLTLPKITIDNGSFSAEVLESDTIGIGAIFNLFGGKEMELKDGSLISELAMEGVQGSTSINFTLLQDGMLWLELASNGETEFSLYYTPVAAQ